MPNLIHKHLLQVKTQIIEAEHRFQRLNHSVKLIAVSKSQPIQAIKEAIDAGQFVFGENYAQEAVEKIKQLQGNDLEWHFLGGIQSNKTKLIAENFHWVHSLCAVKTAARLNKYRAVNLQPLNVCIQINLDQEPNKAGIYLEDLTAFAQSLEKLPYLKLRGLMTIPKKRTKFSAQRNSFKKLRLAFIKLQQLGFKIDTLSMGMSDDFVAAIAEESTCVRIGTAIFGRRPSSR
ncbi:alanine racemase domain protein [Candidatus Rickettsiella viridis]|uniref:Pyridoxal phosphate homeostasis protein n=1 Tax=Candidatus Rickettsiella viridis TaxID=676208 RepID=A0A2Z5V267_9COXI|nr:YggS family pyridoxal phosphate-dependent enzyme [Candidatus Rickettsiella viridis]BBB14552.1 alanine racemase domain protein [Candidatus Rickettsiella viridis]